MSVDSDKVCELTNVVLRVNNDEQELQKPHKQPSRILHFSDGDLVEYSEDETDSSPKLPPQKAAIDPKTLDWLPWTWYQASWASGKLLGACDCVGDTLADFFGITSPKYAFEIEECKRQELNNVKRQLERDKYTELYDPKTGKHDSLIMEDIRLH